MKYNWSIRTLGRQMQVWLCLLVFIVSIFSITILNVQRAYADQNAQWIDKVTIVIGTTRYIDIDPFDTNYNHTGNLKNGKCEDALNINNMDESGDSGTITKQKVVADTGDCAPDGTEHVSLSGTSSRWVTAYQLDADHIFMPAYHAWDGLNQGALTSATLRDGYFQRLDNDNEECRRDDNVSHADGLDKDKCMIFDRKTDGKLDFVPPTSAGTSVWITTNPKEHDAPIYKYSLCYVVVGQDTPCSINNSHVTFANNRVFTKPPDVAAYNTKGKTDTSGSSNNEVAPTCESNNSGNPIAWLVCGLINALDSAVTSATSTVEDLLSFNGDDFRADESLHTTWSLFRAIASFSLLGVALVMIIGQAIGGGE
jgi:hypothetical protein